MAGLGGLLLAPILGVAATWSPKWTAAGAAALAAGLFFLWQPLWTAYLLILSGSLNYRHVNLGFALLGPGDLMNLAMIGVFVLNRLARGGWRRPAHFGWLIAFLALALASAAAGVNPGQGFNRLVRALVGYGGALALVDLIRTRRQLKGAVWVLFSAGLLQALMALFIFPFGARLGGYPQQPNVLAVFTSLGALAAAGLLIHHRERRHRILIGLGFGLMALTTLLAVSRSSYLGLALALTWWFAKNRRSLIIASLTGGALFLAYTQLDTQREYIERRMDMRDVSVTNRSLTYENALKAIAARPLLGVGFGQFTQLDEAVAINAQRGRSAHSFFLGLPASSGLPAAFALLMFLGLQCRRVWRNKARAHAEDDPEGTWLMATFQAIIIYRTVTLLFSEFLNIHGYNLIGLLMVAAALPRLAEERAGDPEAAEIDRPGDGALQQPSAAAGAG